MLINAKRLKEDPSLAGISIAKCLPRAKIDQVKNLREQYSGLNKDCPPNAFGSKPYVVISGRLIKQVEGGKLQRVLSNTPKKTGIALLLPSAGSPKNGVGGTQAAPVGSLKIASKTVVNGTQLAL